MKLKDIPIGTRFIKPTQRVIYDEEKKSFRLKTEEEMSTSHTGDKPLVYDMPSDELTQHEIEEALTVMRAIKKEQRGYMIVSPSFKGGRGLHIAGPLEKRKAA